MRRVPQRRGRATSQKPQYYHVLNWPPWNAHFEPDFCIKIGLTDHWTAAVSNFMQTV